MSNKQKEFDWFKWAGIEPDTKDKLIDKANTSGVPVFDGDTEETIYNRLLMVKTLKIHKALVVISFLSAVISISALFWKT